MSKTNVVENNPSSTTNAAAVAASRQRTNIRKSQNTLLIWLDSNADEKNEEYGNIMTQIKHVINNVEPFTTSDSCIEFLHTIDKNKACMVISSSLCQHVVPQVHDMSQVDSIFIFSNDPYRHEHWIKTWPKIKGVYAEISRICEIVKQIVRQVEQNAMPISFVAADRRIDQLNPTFMYTQIFKEIILTIEFDSTHRQQYINYCREVFSPNEEETARVKRLEQTYRKEKAIWWYTYQCFLYPMLNKALQLMDGDIIIKMGFFIKDLHQHIEQLYMEQFVYKSSKTSFTVYRGQGFSSDDFEQMQQSKDGLISFNNFLSTSTDRLTALTFAEDAISNPDCIGILFVMQIDPVRSTTPFASITNVSAHEDENEILFSMHTIFRINNIKQMSDNNRLYEVHLALTSDNDPELFELSCHMRQESYPGQEAWSRLGALLLRMGQANTAEEIYQTLLRQTTDDSERAPIYERLSLAKYSQGKYQETITFCTKVLTIYQQTSSSEPINLANVYNRMGSAYLRMGNYSNALKNHQDALRILKQSVNAYHPDLAKTYNNIGLAYYNMSDYTKALSFHEKALEISEEALPSNHPDLASSYNNIGSVYQSMGNFDKALSYYERDFAISQQSLPPNHPDLASSYNNIGSVYQSMGNFEKALSYYEKDLRICKQSLSFNHPDLAKSYNNIGSVYRRMGEYTKSLSYHEKALKIYERSLEPDHPDFASCYNYIGNVYRSMDDPKKALSYYQKALNISERALMPNHPDLASAYNNIGNVYCSMGKSDKALEFHEKALAIRQQSLPNNHPDIGSSYSNIAAVYENMRDYLKARLFFERALRNAEHSLFPERCDLQPYKDNLARVKKKC